MVDVQQIVVATGFTAITHPFAYAKVLIQVCIQLILALGLK